MANAEPLPADEPLELYRGDTRLWEMHLADDPVPPATVGLPIDLTGYEFLAEIRVSADPDATLMASFAIDVVDPANGIITRTLTATEAAKLTPGSARHDLQLTDPDGKVRTWLAGRVKVRGDVSHT
jgi:hypothetical protein